MARRRPSRWASEAALQALVRFNPEESGLNELQRVAESGYDTAVKQARGTAAGIMGAIDTSRAQVGQTYDEAGLRQAQTAQLVDQGVQGLGGVADSIKAGLALERGTAGRQLNVGRATAQTDLSSRRVAAKEGEAFAINNAQSNLVSELTKVLQRKQELRREKGAFTALTESQLQDAARERSLKVAMKNADLAQSDLNSRRSASTSRANALTAAETSRQNSARSAGGRAPGGAKRATPLQHGRTSDSVAEARAIVRDLKGEYKSRSEMARDLVRGVPGQTITDPKTKQKLRDPGVKKLPQLIASVALDLEYDGGVSRRNVRELHKRGLTIKDLGFPTMVMQKKRTPRKPRGAAGYNGPT